MERVECPTFATGCALSNDINQPSSAVNDRTMPAGTISSLTDCGSDGCENENGRRCELETSRLQKAARPNGLEREASLDKFRTPHLHGPSISEWSTISDTKSTLGARNIFQSRSCTDTTIHFSRPTLSGALARMSCDSNEDDSSLDKALLVRKKSGELVQPALRPSPRRGYNSMPGTSADSRSVHFNDFDNQTRYFFQDDNAMDISADSSPVETIESETASPFGVTGKAMRSIKLINFSPHELERGFKPVRLERLFLSPDKDTLVGNIAVHNLSFQKVVVARFTLDHWRTTSELVAEYEKDLRGPSSDSCDRFTFHMELSDIADIDDKSLLLCARYNVNGQDYWDNNDSMDYHIEFVRAIEKCTRLTTDLCPVAKPLGSVPRIQYSPQIPPYSSYRFNSIDRKFGARTDVGLNHHFDSSSKALDNDRGVEQFDAKLKGNGLCSAGLPKLHNNFKRRYNFDASLSAASPTIQDRCCLGVV
jgi:hypothetical protein